jgi:hypothetical protein
VRERPHSDRSGGVVRMPRDTPLAAPISRFETALSRMNRAKVRILHFKYLRHSDMASVLITAFEIFTRVSPNNSLECLTECSVGIV